ncbi:hypothetical protein HOH11_01260 [Candidatus Woesearchaeota archaeon]|jgi:uncharacterized protein YycO|nr:hypothetical protein [Candidatus Woesearchaeota archaeon]MBT6023212.1 hypothetical protein [Candidatus Woesearchaeota archaeon]
MISIKNFPKRRNKIKRLYDNFVFNVFGSIITRRRNWLSKKDIKKSRRKIRKGDILLLGNLRTAYSKIINEPITHSAIYVGGNKVIHAMGEDGVFSERMLNIYKRYDTLIILRSDLRKKEKALLIRNAKSAIGIPYDFSFSNREDSFFCTEFVNKMFKKVGYKTNLISLHEPRSKSERVLRKINNAAISIRPSDFLKGNFTLIFLSHNLIFKNNKLKLIN